MEHHSETALLQLRYPDVYQRLIEQSEKIGLHSYDLKADVLEPLQSEKDTDKPGEKVTIRVRYGETFSEYEDLSIERNLLSPDNDTVVEFFQQCVENAHETLKNEYKESMNIGRPRQKRGTNGG